VPHILADGAGWLRANGTGGAPGTMLFTVCGDLQQEGVFELPLGSPLRYLVEELAGGPPDGRVLKAIFPGASNTVLAPEQLDVPLDFDSMRQVGSGLGSGRVRGVRRLGLHGAGGLAVLAVPVGGVMRPVPGLQVRHRRGHPDPGGDPGRRRPWSEVNRGQRRRCRPAARRVSGGPLAGRGPLFDLCLPAANGLVDPAHPIQVV